MSSAALYETVNEKAHAIDDGVRRFAFGKDPSSTELYPLRRSLTEEFEVRKSIQILPEKAPASKSTAATGLSLMPAEYFKPIKNWEGVVDSVSEKYFCATMRDAGNGADKGDEQFEISIEDVEIGDRALIVPGGIFYFTVGYSIRRGGTRVKGTQVVFRRMPLWSKRDLQKAEERTDKFMEILGVSAVSDEESAEAHSYLNGDKVRGRIG